MDISPENSIKRSKELHLSTREYVLINIPIGINNPRKKEKSSKIQTREERIANESKEQKTTYKRIIK